MSKKVKIKRKHKIKPIGIYAVLLILVIIIILMSTAYSLWSTKLDINGNVVSEYVEPQLDVTPVSQSSTRYSTNTTLQTKQDWWGLVTVTIFRISGDSYEKNILTTNLSNYQTSWYNSTISVTFTVKLKNNSSSTYTDGTITTSESDSSGYMTPTSQQLSDITLAGGNTTTFTCKITLQANYSTQVGSYEDYKICYKVDGVRRYFHYKILVAA